MNIIKYNDTIREAIFNRFRVKYISLRLKSGLYSYFNYIYDYNTSKASLFLSIGKTSELDSENGRTTIKNWAIFLYEEDNRLIVEFNYDENLTRFDIEFINKNLKEIFIMKHNKDKWEVCFNNNVKIIVDNATKFYLIDRDNILVDKSSVEFNRALSKFSDTCVIKDLDEL